MDQCAHEEQVEQNHSKDTALFDSICDLKGTSAVKPSKHKAYHVILELVDDVCKFPWSPKPGEHDSRSTVSKANENSVKVHPLLDELSLDLYHQEDHVDNAAAWSENTLSPQQ